MHPVGVGGDIDQPHLTELVEPGLLRLDHGLVLEKGRGDLAIELLGRLRFVLAIAVRRRPEIKAAGLGFRSQAVEQTELETEIAIRVSTFTTSFGSHIPSPTASSIDQL